MARETVGVNVTMNNLLPGGFGSVGLGSRFASQGKSRGIPAEQAMDERRKQIPAERFGEPEEFGEACAYLCSAQAGYITGQNFLIDGGAYPGTF